ncbi:aldo/keto reductase [Pelagibacterium xiamenense]|uniref:aldo/keto reductase n=1 Tax=Pelagibacterium xiamenense TaxID=2901140 RepID=UPI001E3CD602|nr:aldo/keto reductase [Pelagibacterium xiamenense]MCD7058952.1 aldo/keto reductase [Pelagibacterium xiamenense]
MPALDTTIPRLGFGTNVRKGSDGIRAIVHALETGYRHIDTAQDYQTEGEVGAAVAQSGLPRSEVFVTTKIAPRNFGPGALIPSLEKSLETTKLEQFDLVLIHWPSPHGEVPLEVYLTQLAEAQDKGLTRLMGVSNFTIALLEESAKILGAGRIATNQIELNPVMQNKTLADYCMNAGVLVTCYRPIARGALSSENILADIAEAHSATTEQVSLAFELAKGYCAIPTSGNPQHIRSNYAAVNLKLSDADIARIETMDRNHRTVDPEWAPEWD